jgi:hypothetical protein
LSCRIKAVFDSVFYLVPAQQLLDMIDQLDAVEGTRRGLEEMKAGLGKHLDSVDKGNRKKHRIPRDA